jgi:hypothetical protein
LGKAIVSPGRLASRRFALDVLDIPNAAGVRDPPGATKKKPGGAFFV